VEKPLLRYAPRRNMAAGRKRGLSGQTIRSGNREISAATLSVQAGA